MGASLSQPPLEVRRVCLTHPEGILHLPALVATGPPEAWTPSIQGEHGPRDSLLAGA